jgi:hypothetical protein
MSEPLAHTIDAAVKISGIGRTPLYLLIGTGKIAARKCGNRTLIMADSLRDYVANSPPASITCGQRKATA